MKNGLHGVLAVVAVLAVVTSAVAADEYGNIFLNHGESASAYGPDPGLRAGTTDTTDGKFGSTCLYPRDGIPGSYGAVWLTADSYNPDQGTIEFWYKAVELSGPTGDNVIFTTGPGSPSNGSHGDALNFYQNLYSNVNGPTVTASIGTSTWAYQAFATDHETWEWDPNRWYFFSICYKMKNEPNDFVHLYIDGVLQTGFNGPEYRAIDASPTTIMGLGGYTYYNYSPTPGKFDDIRIVEPIIRTGDFTPPTGELELLPANCQEVIDTGMTLVADLNNDCYVEWADFGIFASQWQECNNPEDANCDW